MNDLHSLIRENGYQQAITEMLLAFPFDGSPQIEKVRAKLWDMAFPLKELNEEQKKQLINEQI